MSESNYPPLPSAASADNSRKKIRKLIRPEISSLAAAVTTSQLSEDPKTPTAATAAADSTLHGKRRRSSNSPPHPADAANASEYNPRKRRFLIRWTVVISDDCTIYCLCHNTKTISWHGESDLHNSYRATHSSLAKQYLDANVDGQGQTHIVWKDGQGKDTNYAWKDFFEHHIEGAKAQLKFDHRTSKNRITCTLEDGSSTEIKRTAHFIRSSDLDWDLVCPIFEVTDTRVRVRNTLTHKNFFNLCLQFQDFKTSEGLSLMDLNAHRWSDQIKLDPVIPSASRSDGLLKGQYCENSASIHVIRNGVDIYQKYMHLRKISTSPHENVQTFFGMKKEGENFLCAFQPVVLSLADYMRMVDVQKLGPQFLQVLRGIIEGLKHIHSVGLVHGDINPWNTYVWNGKFKYGGYNNWKSAESSSKGLDYDAVAKLIAYIFSFHAVHTKVTNKDEYSKLSLKYFKSNMHLYAKEASRVVDLLSDRSRTAATLNRILRDTWLWLGERRILYYKEVQEILFDKHKRGEYVVGGAAFQAKLSKCWDSKNADGWSNCFSSLLMAIKNPYHYNNKGQKVYEYDVWDGMELMRFIRNLYSHHCKSGGHDHNLESLGESVEDLEFLIRRSFPDLMVEVHSEVERQGLHTKLKLKHFHE